MGPEKLVLVEHVGEHALQLLLVEDRQQTPSFIADETLVGRGHMGHDLGMAFPEQGDHLHQLRIATGRIPLEHRRRTQRQEPHQRPHLQTHRLAVGQPQQIVKESVLFIPHLVVMLADAVHRVGDPQ